MYKFKLKSGTHECNNADGVPTRYDKGQVIETETDLIAKFGEERFELMAGKMTLQPRPEGITGFGHKFPGGQVLDGVQETSGNRETGESTTGVARPNEVDLEKEVLEPEKKGAKTDDKKAPEFDTMSAAQLRAYCEQNEIDTKGANDRASILKILKAK